MIDEVFHHTKALPDIIFDLKMHENRADKADAENRNIKRQADRKVLLPRHYNGRNNQKGDLQTGDENGALEGQFHILIIKLQLLPRIPVQRLESHHVRIVLIQVEHLVRLFDLLEQSLPLALSSDLKLIS